MFWLADRLGEPDPWAMADRMPSHVFQQWSAYHRAKQIERDRRKG